MLKVLLKTCQMSPIWLLSCPGRKQFASKASAVNAQAWEERGQQRGAQVGARSGSTCAVGPSRAAWGLLAVKAVGPPGSWGFGFCRAPRGLWFSTSKGKGSKENFQAMGFWHDVDRVMGCMEGLKENFYSFGFPTCMSLFWWAWEGSVVSFNMTWSLSDCCVFGTQLYTSLFHRLQSHVAVPLVLHLCGNTPVWDYDHFHRLL